MKLGKKSLSLLTCCFLLALAAVVPASASAAIQWSQGETVETKWEITSLSVKKGTGTPITCSSTTAGGLASNNGGEGATAFAENYLVTRILMSCAGSTTLEWAATIEPTALISAGKYKVTLYERPEEFLSPFGGVWSQDVTALEGTWVNGSGSTASTLTFTNAHVGTQQTNGFAPIYLTTSIKVKTKSGGLLTLTGS